MAEHVTDEDLDLLGNLGVDTAPAAAGGRSAKEQRIIAGFEEIERFLKEHGRPPEHGAHRDIFERLYAVRLDRIRQSPECREVLEGIDSHGLLSAVDGATAEVEAAPGVEPSDEELLASLGIDELLASDVTNLVHVRSREEINAAEEIAQRNACRDFDDFRPIFEKVQEELQSGARETVKYKENAEVKKGDLFFLDGQKLIVAELGAPFVSDYGRADRRLRVVYDNGTESDLLVRSLQRALNKDKVSRRITRPGFGPLFSGVAEEDDLSSGFIYVLRSQSDHPYIAEHRSAIHKIGVTIGEVKSRIAGARKDPTYLLADVELMATYKLANVNRKALEALLHRFLGGARLDVELKNRFGSQVEPKEWFFVPLPAIEETIERLIDGTIGNYRYDLETASLVPA